MSGVGGLAVSIHNILPQVLLCYCRREKNFAGAFDKVDPPENLNIKKHEEDDWSSKWQTAQSLWNILCSACVLLGGGLCS